MIHNILLAATIAAATSHQNEAIGQIIKNGKMVYTEITINAVPEKVWEVLTKFNDYPAWNPFVKSLTGKPHQGGKISVLLQPQGKSTMKFTPRILQFLPNTELRWLGKLGIGYIFDGEHTFKLIDNGDGTTTFCQFEHFRGLLVPFMRHMLDNNTKSGFEAMNNALKKRVEG